MARNNSGGRSSKHMAKSFTFLGNERGQSNLVEVVGGWEVGVGVEMERGGGGGGYLALGLRAGWVSQADADDVQSMTWGRASQCCANQASNEGEKLPIPPPLTGILSPLTQIISPF